MRTIRAGVIVLFLIFLGLGVLYGQATEGIVISCRDVETGYIHVRWAGSPFGIFEGTLEITKSALGGDLVLVCGRE